MIDQTDHELIARATRNADRDAFAELVRRHQSTLRASMRKLTGGNAELADDVAQEAFISAWRNLSQFRADAKFSTWLYRIGFNAWQTLLRKRGELLIDDVGVADSSEHFTNAATDAPNEADRAGARRDIARAMATLTEAEHTAILHCYYQDLSHEEAAYVLGIPLGTLKTHVLKAKAKMRLHLGAYAPP